MATYLNVCVVDCKQEIKSGSSDSVYWEVRGCWKPRAHHHSPIMWGVDDDGDRAPLRPPPFTTMCARPALTLECCWRVPSPGSPGKQSSGPPGAGAGAQSRLDNENQEISDWLAVVCWVCWVCRLSWVCEWSSTESTHSADQAVSAQGGPGRPATADTRTQGLVWPGSARARWPWDLGFGLMVLLCVLGPASTGSTLNRHFLTAAVSWSQLWEVERAKRHNVSHKQVVCQ